MRGLGVGALLAAWSLASCGGGADIDPALQREAERIAAIPPPADWDHRVPADLDDSQLVRDVDGVAMVFAGDFRDLDEVRPLGVGTAWSSPVVSDATIAGTCATAASFVERAGFAGVVGADELARCVALPTDPLLREEFAASFADGYEQTADGVRTIGANVRLRDDGTVVVVVTVAFALHR